MRELRLSLWNAVPTIKDRASSKAVRRTRHEMERERTYLICSPFRTAIVGDRLGIMTTAATSQLDFAGDVLCSSRRIKRALEREFGRYG